MSRRDDIKKLIVTHTRLLQKLKEQQALFGLHTPPHILTEIEDRETELEKLQQELKDLAEKKEATSLEERQKQPPLVPIILIMVAVIGFIGIFIVAWMQKPSSPTSATLETSRSSPSFTPDPTPTLPLFTTATNMGAVATPSLRLTCIDNYLRDVTLERQISLEVGSTEQDLVISAKDRVGNDPIGPLAVRLTRNGQSIGAIRFLVLHQDDTFLSFSVIAVVDRDCGEVTDYVNVTRPHSASTLQNWDGLGIPSGGSTYVLRFGWQGDHIRFGFRELE